MTRAELQDVAERYVEAWNRHEPAAIAQYHTPDGVAESPMYATLRGRAAVQEAARAFISSFPDATQVVDSIIVDPPQVALFVSTHATHMNEFFGLPGTNRRIEFRVAWQLRMNDDGLIHYERRIYDFTGVLLQLGVLRAKPMKP